MQLRIYTCSYCKSEWECDDSYKYTPQCTPPENECPECEKTGKLVQAVDIKTDLPET